MSRKMGMDILYTVFEKLLCAVLILVTLPLQILIYILIKVTSPGPGLYACIRIGRNSSPIVIVKFRTMTSLVAMKLMAEILENEEWLSNQKIKNDRRITFVGKFLRRFSLDELPQLWSVLTGDMHLVGPRPVIRSERWRYGKYTEIIHSVKPGITGLWQVSGRNLTTYRRRKAINVYYVKHRSWKLDLWIIYRTIWAVLGGRGAF